MAEQKQETPPETPAKVITEHRVVNVGISYRDPDQPVKGHGARFARKGEIVRLDADEAARLTALFAVVGKDDPAPKPRKAVGLPPSMTPYGGKPQMTNEEHAASVRAQLA